MRDTQPGKCYRGAGEVEEVMFESEMEKFLYLTEEMLKNGWEKDCPLCRGAGCDSCYLTGMMHAIESRWSMRDANCVMELDRNWLRAIASKIE